MTAFGRTFLLAISIFMSTFTLKGQVIGDTIWFSHIDSDEDSFLLFPYFETSAFFTLKNKALAKTVRKSVKHRSPVYVEYDSSFNVTNAVSIELEKEEYLSYFIPESEILPRKSIRKNLKKYSKKIKPGKEYYRSLKPFIRSADLIPIYQEILDHSCENNLNCSCNAPCYTFQFNPNGCFARAHWIRERVEYQHGYLTKKIYAISDYRPPASKRLVAKNIGACGLPETRWTWHVSSLIKVQNPDGTYTDLVLEPSLSHHPVTVDEWIRLIEYDGGEVLDSRIVSSRYYGLTDATSLDINNFAPDDDYSKTKAFLMQHCEFCNELKSVSFNLYMKRYRRLCKEKIYFP